MSIGSSIGQPMKSAGDFEVDGDLHVTGDTNFDGNLEVSGDYIAVPTGNINADSCGITGSAVILALEVDSLLVTGDATLVGASYIGVPSSEPTLTESSQISFYLDETNNKLKVKVKYIGGTTKTGEIALS